MGTNPKEYRPPIWASNQMIIIILGTNPKDQQPLFKHQLRQLQYVNIQLQICTLLQVKFFNSQFILYTWDWLDSFLLTIFVFCFLVFVINICPWLSILFLYLNQLFDLCIVLFFFSSPLCLFNLLVSLHLGLLLFTPVFLLYLLSTLTSLL